MNEKEKITNLRFKLFLEAKGIKEEKYLRNKNIVKNTEYMEFIDNYIASYQKIPGNEDQRVESNPEEFDDYLKFKVLSGKLEMIARKEENIGIKELEECKEAKKLLEKYDLTNEDHTVDTTALIPRLKTSFVFGVQKRITEHYRRELLNTIPEAYLEKYLKALSYENELEEGEYTDMQRRLKVAENVQKIEENPKQIKFLVYFSESSEFKENEILTLEEAKEKYNLAKIEHDKDLEKVGETYKKISLILLVDNVETINIINPPTYIYTKDYDNFEEYINKNFSEQINKDYL